MSLSSRAVAVAASTGCPRLASAARRGWSDVAVAKTQGIDSLTPRLAFAEGQAFERRAIGDGDGSGDQKLLDLLGLLGGRIVRFPDGDADDAMLAEFEQALADPEVAVIVQGVLPGLYGGWHRPDLMIRTATGWQIGEVKVYLDRGGDTPARLVQSTAAQCAVSIVACRERGIPVSDDATIVLASPRGEPVTRTIPVGGEVDLVRELQDRAPRGPKVVGDPSLPVLDDHIYSPACEGACALADLCRMQASAAPGVIWPGDAVAVTYGWKHEDLLAQAGAGDAPVAVQAGWAAAVSI